MSTIWYRGWPVLSSITPWDDGLRWFLEDAEAPDWDLDPLTVEFVRDQHLRSPNGSAEDDYITHLIRTSYWQAERRTERTLIPRDRVLVADGFPSSGTFLLPGPPLISVTSIDYLDGDGVSQPLTGSPDEFYWETSSGPLARRGRVTPLYSASWPSTRLEMGAVRITFRAGYEPLTVGGLANIPDEINAARLLIIGELYKQRSESVIGASPAPALVRARDMFFGYRVFA